MMAVDHGRSCCSLVAGMHKAITPNMIQRQPQPITNFVAISVSHDDLNCWLVQRSLLLSAILRNSIERGASPSRRINSSVDRRIFSIIPRARLASVRADGLKMTANSTLSQLVWALASLGGRPVSFVAVSAWSLHSLFCSCARRPRAAHALGALLARVHAAPQISGLYCDNTTTPGYFTTAHARILPLRGARSMSTPFYSKSSDLLSPRRRTLPHPICYTNTSRSAQGP
ncbi:hypothetical protein FA95DRAFT_1162122 [Auriscalpium vulgare]|uniref:Uncharacterized protein n=1 Tax=Auriscalpium vulgare TaxID=40419 RepID=A0ACB8S9H4_9AGAM|nr:hypothetical protein FA95DRAFT_1162122 [Auriscalpium vulgare]